MAAILRLLLLGAMAVASQAAEPLARHLVGLGPRPGNPRGVAVVAGGDAALARALAADSSYLVVCQVPDGPRQRAAAAGLDGSGLLGQRIIVTVHAGPGSAMADASVNLFIAQVPGADLPDPGPIVRCLAPEAGTALIGSTDGTGPDAAALRRWAAAVPGCTTTIDTSRGTWAVLRRTALPGAAMWTHRYYDPSNRPVSPESAFAWPPILQWLGRPHHDGGSLSLMAGGRVLIAFSSEGSKAARIGGNALRSILLMRDAGNGQVLWERPGDVNRSLERRMSSVVLLPDALYLADPGGAVVLGLDPDTGAERQRWDLAQHGAEVKWLAIDGDRLFAALGPIDVSQRSGDQWRWFSRQYGNKDPYGMDLCQTVVALDRRSGKLLWRHAEAAPAIHEATLAVHQGRVYLLARGAALRCLDAASGNERWANGTTARLWDELASKPESGAFGSHGYLQVGPAGVGAIYIPTVGALGFDTAQGDRLWSYRGASHPLLLEDRAYTCGNGMGSGNDKTYVKAIFDPRTGAIQGSSSAKQQGDFSTGTACGSASMSSRFWSGSWGITYDFDRKLNLGGRGAEDHRNNCNAVGLFAGGFYFAQAYECTCGYQTTGQVMQTARGDLATLALPAAQRLVRAADPTPRAQTPAAAGDWWTARRSTDRDASSPVRLAARPEVRWTVQPTRQTILPYNRRTVAAPQEPVLPIAVGDRAYVAGADGMLRALDLANGRQVWAVPIGTRLFQPPTYWNGRLLIGSGDGHILAIDAADGRELWRYLPLGMQRLMLAYGQVTGTWPITSGVVVEGDRCYAIACLHGICGTVVSALDPADGRLLWENASSGGESSPTLDGMTPVGLPTIADGHLWVRGIGYALKDGTLVPKSDSNGPLVRATGHLGGCLRLTGGWRFFGDQQELQPIKSGDTGLMVTKPGAGRIALSTFAVGLGAWDDRQLTTIAGVPTHILNGPNKADFPDELVCWNRTDLDAFLEAQFALPAKGGKRASLEAGGVKLEKGKARPSLPVQPQATAWRFAKARIYAAVLAADVAVAACGTQSSAEPEQPGATWMLVGLDRASGAERWSVPLPGTPLEGGLAIAADGTVVVQLLDGGVLAVR